MNESVFTELLAEIRRLRSNSQIALSVKSAADALDTSDKTVAKWIGEGRIRAIPNTGRRVLVARVELERFAAEESRRLVLQQVAS